MRKIFLLGLMAAAAIVPAMASAQDRDGWRGRRGGDSGASQPQSNNGGNRGNGGGWRGRGDGNTATPMPTPAPAPAARGDGGNRWAGRNGGTGGWAGRNGGNAGGGDQTRAQAEAQGRADRGRWNGNGGNNNGGRFGGWAGRNGGVTPDANDQARAQAEARARADRNRFDGNRNNNGWRDNRTNRNNGWNGNNNNWRGNDGNRGGNWNRSWRGNNQYDWQRYRTSNRNAFRLPRYYAPYGWSYGYRRFSIGFVLDQVLFGQSYWIDDPYNYRLPEADGEYRWVRYYNDALLVDIYTGEVVDTVYDIFY